MKIKTYTATSSPATLHTVLPISAPPIPNLLRPLIFRRLAHVSTLYQYKTKTYKSIFFCQTQINILIRYSPHPLRSVAHSPHHSTHSYTVLDKGEKMHMKQSPYQLHPQQFLSSSSSFCIMLHIKSDKYSMVCLKLLWT